MKILQNEITGTQTSFSTNFGGKLSFISLSEPVPPDCTSPILDGGQFIQRLWVGQRPATVSFWAGLKKKSPFSLTFFFPNLFYKLINPILEPTAPLLLSLPAFLVGPTLWCQMSPGTTCTASSPTPLLVPT